MCEDMVMPWVIINYFSGSGYVSVIHADIDKLIAAINNSEIPLNYFKQIYINKCE